MEESSGLSNNAQSFSERARSAGFSELLVLGRLRQNEVAMACAEVDRRVAHEVAEHDGAPDNVGECPVAAIGDGPDRSANRGCHIAPLSAELPVVVAAVQQLE